MATKYADRQLMRRIHIMTHSAVASLLDLVDFCASFMIVQLTPTVRTVQYELFNFITQRLMRSIKLLFMDPANDYVSWSDIRHSSSKNHGQEEVIKTFPSEGFMRLQAA
ncbi:hypothetical protein QR680_015084 [Steinernema hermaphroditum]|uniref:Uncharacterized protein n=1 Tax=Steinernema hermaphroditum TaxID=289476 RepID=A0AA39IDQ5_9BILA|nr:hypothetical protein QR680_015084 [Steinernema hermaphroditum]